MAKKKSLGEYGVLEKEEVTIEGTVVWSRIGRKVEGEELEKERRNAQDRHQVPPTKPFYRLVLEDPRIIPKTPGAPTPFEQYWADNKIYPASNGAMRTTAESLGNFLTTIQLNPETNTWAEIDMQDKELAKGSKVQAVVKSFKSSYGTIGSGLQYVIVLDPVVKYYERRSSIGIDNYMESRYGAKKSDGTTVETQVTPAPSVEIEEDAMDDASAAYDPFAATSGNPFA